MAQAVRGIRWRIAWLVAGAAVAVLWRVAGGGAGGHVIQIEFGMAPELDGAVVRIDHQDAGTLAKRRNRTVTGFRVGEGRHVVEVGTEACSGVEALVTTGFGAGTVMLVAEKEGSGKGGEAACRVVLRR